MKFLKLFVITFLVALSLTSTSFALNFSQDYWTLTDMTTAVNGNSLFQLVLENADYESDFGLYTKSVIDNTTFVDKKFQIFGKNEEPSTYPPTKKTVSFKKENNVFSVTLDNNIDNTTIWTEFDSVFGFYFDVYTGGQTDTTKEYTWYTDISLNVDNSEHIGTIYNNFQTEIKLDDQWNGTNFYSDRDFDDMIVFADDVAPVPEPATMFLLGSGILGLAASRKKMKK